MNLTHNLSFGNSPPYLQLFLNYLNMWLSSGGPRLGTLLNGLQRMAPGKSWLLQSMVVLLLHSIYSITTLLKLHLKQGVTSFLLFDGNLAPFPLHTSGLLFQTHKGNKKEVATLTVSLGFELGGTYLKLALS